MIPVTVASARKFPWSERCVPRSAATVALIRVEGCEKGPYHAGSEAEQRRFTGGEHQHGREQGRSRAELVHRTVRDGRAGDLAEFEEHRVQGGNSGRERKSGSLGRRAPRRTEYN